MFLNLQDERDSYNPDNELLTGRSPSFQLLDRSTPISGSQQGRGTPS